MNPEENINVPVRECFSPFDGDNDPLERGYQRSLREMRGWIDSGRIASLRKPAVLLLLLMLVGWMILDVSLFRMLLRVAVGWLVFLWETVPQIHVDGLSLVNGVVGLVVVCAVLHWLLASVFGRTAATGHRWRWRTTLSIVAVVAVMFGICVATVGLVTSIGWASSSAGKLRGSYGTPRDQNRHNASYLVSNGRHVALQEDGKLPEDLFGALAMASSLFREPFVVFFDENLEQPPQYFTWLGKGLDATGTPGDVPVAVAPHPYADGTRLVAFMDERVEECTEEEWQAALVRWRQTVMDTQIKEEVK
ncbi:hypothetical protein DES53_109103 [Roseimicrobium gellanilyticum]|uniref:Uncharacterized protein n=2 Tax=Roseimicrobium gellanilyticum TaxID=748857 RepID=A0A366HBJ1_9BACT|nr:hypothetical protein DES53_109103 [Roseimicrobium gellanilyticum]